MYLIQESLNKLSGRKFKLFLQRITKNKVGAVAGGAIVTGVLQSSSMVSVMVLSFVGAGIFTMKNALAIILGANLGTTLDSWIVATLGFKMNIEIAAYPAAFLGGLLLILFGRHQTAKYIAYFLFGFGLLFIGLTFMTTAMEAQVNTFNFEKYAQMSLVVFLLIGFCITLLVQSSSVTMAIALSAIHAGAIGFAPAAALVLGSETGTTIKIMLGSIGGNAAKKRVALGNFFFNVILTVVAFALLQPTLLLITNVLAIKDPLIGLVTFSSLVNLLSITIFLPFLSPFAKLLERFFKDTDAANAAFISYDSIAQPDLAFDLFKKETAYFIHNTMLHNLALFDVKTTPSAYQAQFIAINQKRKFDTKTPEEKYEFLKQLQGELQAFYLALRPQLPTEQNAQLSQLISSVRSAMHAAKSMKDSGNDILNLQRSSKDIKFDFFVRNKKEIDELYREFAVLMQPDAETSFEKLQSVFNNIQNNFSSSLHEFYKDAPKSQIEDIDITTVLNFNRELFTSNKAMLMAIKDFLLNEKQAIAFNEISVYKT